MKPRTFILTGGGTGGHLYPAIAIAEALQDRYADAKIVFVGSTDRMESKVIPAMGYPYYPVRVKGLQRKRILANLQLPMIVWQAVQTASSILKKENPACVISTGGYVGFPLLYAARGKYPTYIHEQNEYPGLVVRLLEKHVNNVFVTFEETKKHLKQPAKAIVTGNPVRKAIGKVQKSKARAKLGIKGNVRVVLAFGGSLGARSINDAMKAYCASNPENVSVIWQTGERDYTRIAKEFSTYPHLAVHKYIDDIEYAYAAADVVVCRSGATSIAEILVARKPSILIPYPYATNDHQAKNAEVMQRYGCSRVIPDAQAVETLRGTLQELLTSESALHLMSEKTKALRKENAANRIVDVIESELANSGGRDE